MNAPRRRLETAVTPEALSLVDTYFARVQGAMLVSAADEAAEAVEELRSHVLEELAAGDGSAAAVSRILGELGAPEDLAAEYAGTDEASPLVSGQTDEVRGIGHGRVLGIPYDVRVPTTARVASRLWDPMNPHILVPRVWGAGWDINFGALAVKTGIVRPDDEDEPFEAAPPAAVLATLAVPLTLAAAVLVLMAVRYSSLPAELPTNWDLAGNAAGYWPKAVDLGLLAALAVLPVLAAVSSHIRRRPALNRVAGSAFATLLSGTALMVTVQTVLTADGFSGVWPVWAGLVLALLLPFVMLTVLSRLGRTGEQRRDMKSDR